MRHEIVGRRHHGNQIRERLTTRTEVATSSDGSEKLFAVGLRGHKTGGYVVETYQSGMLSGECALGKFPSDTAAVEAFFGLCSESSEAAIEESEESEETAIPHDPAFLKVSAAVPVEPMMKGKSGRLKSPKPSAPRVVKVKTISGPPPEGGGRRALAAKAASLTTR